MRCGPRRCCSAPGAGLRWISAAAARALAAISRVAAEHPEIAEIEINPLLVTVDGALGLDARVVLETKGEAMLAEGTFDGKVAIVTGGGSGLGRAVALELARLGAAVVVGGRRAEPLDETVAQIEDEGGAGHAKPTDVRDPDQVDALVDDAVKSVRAGGRARQQRRRELRRQGRGSLAERLARGGRDRSRRWLPLRARGRPPMIEQGDGGAILSVLASYAWTGGPGTVHSASAKAGLLAMTRTLAVEWAAHGIRVNCICPGPDRDRGRRSGAVADGGGPRPCRKNRAARPPRRRRGGRLVGNGALLAVRRLDHGRGADDRRRSLAGAGGLHGGAPRAAARLSAQPPRALAGASACCTRRLRVA